MKKFLFTSKLKGFSLVEALVSIAVLALITGVVSSVLITTNRGGITSINHLKAQNHLNQSFEAIRSIRDQNFMYLTTGNHGLQLINGVWSLTASPDSIDDQFSRQITISDVYRNASGDIDASGTQLDNRSKKVAIQIQWESDVEGIQSVSNEEIITDWQAFERVNSTSSEWGSGTLVQTTVSSSGDGALVLDSYTTSWQISFQDAHYIFNNNANANEIVVVGNIGYMVSNYNGQVPNFTVLDLTDLQNIVPIATLSLNANAYDIAISGNYAYVATADQQNELKTIDISNPASPNLVDQDNLTGPKDAYSIAVDGDKLYIAQEKNNNEEFHIFNIQNPAAPSLIRSYEINADIYDIAVKNNTIYLAISNGATIINPLTTFVGLSTSSTSLIIADGTVPSAVVHLSSLTITPEKNGRSLSYLDNRIYFASSISTSQEFKIIDVSNPITPSVISGVEMGANLHNIDTYDIYAFVTSDKVNQEFQVINVEDIQNPLFDAYLDLDGNGNGIFSNQSAIFITSDDNTSALDILTYPVESYYPTGSFTSNPFDSGSDTTEWLNFHWEGITSPNTSISFQFRFASTEVSLSSATWTGPDGTGSSYYTQADNLLIVPQSVAIPRWMQYQITLTSDGQYTPEVYSIRIQYSP